MADKAVHAEQARLVFWTKSKLPQKNSIVPGVIDSGNMYPHVSGRLTNKVKAVMPVVQSTVEDVNSQSPRTQSLGRSSMSQHVLDTAVCKQVTTASFQGVSLRNLCVEDKKLVTNLIKEPASLSRHCHRSREENDNLENLAWKRLGDQILLAKARREQWLRRFEESSEKDSLAPGVNDLGNMQPCVSGGRTKEPKAVMPVVQSTVEDVNAQSPRTQSLGSSSMSQPVSDTAVCKQVTTASGQGVSLRNLCVEDKKPMANLIKEPASLSRHCHRSREENDNAENNLTVKMKRLDDQIQLVVALQKQWLKGFKESPEKDSLAPGVNDLGNMQPCVSGGRTKEIKAVMPVVQSTVEDVNAQSPRTQSLGSSSDYKTQLLVVDDRKTKLSDRIDKLSEYVEVFSNHYLDEQALLEKLKRSMEAINQQNIDNIDKRFNLINKRLQQEVKEYYRMQLEEQMSLTREDQKVARQLQEQLQKRQHLEKRLQEYTHKEPGDQPHPANSKPDITNNSRLTEVVIWETDPSKRSRPRSRTLSL